jgi:hypothetical protein
LASGWITWVRAGCIDHGLRAAESAPCDTTIRCAGADTADSWDAAVQAVLREGQGLWQLAVISTSSIDALCQRATAGDPDAERCLTVLPALFACLDAYQEPTPNAPNCVTCAAPLWRGCYPGAAVVLSAARDDPSRQLVSAICRDCWSSLGTDAARQDAVLDGLRRAYGLEGLRLLPPLAKAGHA